MEDAMVTILVLPLNSLIMDYQRHLMQMQVPQLYGKGDNENDQLDITKNLVLVSADKAQTSSWQSTLANLGQKKTVAHVVFNEAHISIIAKDYCKSLDNTYISSVLHAHAACIVEHHSPSHHHS